MSAPVLSVVVPVYQSGETLGALVTGIRSVLTGRQWPHEIILVDDASPDAVTRRVLHRLSGDTDVRVVRLRRNRGQHRATISGMSFARGAFTVVMDADLQHDPASIPDLLEPLMGSEDLDAVIAVFTQSRHPILRRFGSRAVGGLIRWSNDLPPGFGFTSFLAMRDDVCRAVVSAGSRAAEPVVGLLLVEITGLVANVPVPHVERPSGRSSWRPRRLVRLATQLVQSVLFTRRGLQLLSSLAISAALLAILMTGYYLIRFWVGGLPLTGFTTLILVLLGSVALSSFLLSAVLEGVVGIRDGVWRDARSDVRSDSWQARATDDR